MNGTDLERLLAGAAGSATGEKSAAEALREVLAGFEGGLARDLGQLVAELGKAQTTSQTQTAAVAENTRMVLQNTAAQVSGEKSSALASVGEVVWKIFGSGLGLSPLAAGLMRLFGGGKAEAPLPLEVYAPPPAIRWEGEITRADGQEQYAWEWEQLWRRSSGTRPAPQITVQVQALDSRSFLDHSEEIARAVREAMLNSHALNDVVSEV